MRFICVLACIVALSPSAGFALDLASVIDRLENGSSEERKAAVVEVSRDLPADFAPLVGPLLQATGDPSAETRFAAVAMLALTGRRSLLDAERLGTITNELRALLADSDLRVRSAAAEAIGLTQPHTPTSARGDLLALLSDSEPNVRIPVVMGLLRLENITDAERDAVLSVLTSDPSADVRSRTATALSYFPVGGNAAVEALVTALLDDDPVVRHNVSNALAFYGGLASSAVDELEYLAANDPDADVRVTAQLAKTTIENANANAEPDCSAAVATPALFWPPDHKMVGVSVDGVTDPDGDAVTVVVSGVTQDEATDEPGSGSSCPDAVLEADGSVSLRAERAGRLDGRIYRLTFSASDDAGLSCTGVVKVCMPHEESTVANCVEQAEEYDSTSCP